MRNVHREIDRILAHLRTVVHDRGSTQMEVQDALGWGSSYISQLLTRQKGLRLDQVLMILKVIDVDPATFFDQIYHFNDSVRSLRRSRITSSPVRGTPNATALRAGVRRLRLRLDRLVELLKQKGLISDIELAHAIEKSRQRS
ncbi:MAG: helix-turn-helix domain-containing protein [bacterium]|nr:helix-turn-helix domain-containing protein [bacterium]